MLVAGVPFVYIIATSDGIVKLIFCGFSVNTLSSEPTRKHNGGDSELSVANHASVSGKSSSTSGMIFRSLSSEAYGVVSI